MKTSQQKAGPGPANANQDKIYENWTFSQFCGSTPQFTGRHCLLAGYSRLPPAHHPQLLKASINVARQLAKAHTGLSLLDRVAVDPARPDDPIVLWLEGLWNALGIPHYPVRSLTGEDGRLRIYLGMPYGQAIQLSLAMVSQWLNATHAALAGHGFRMNPETLSSLLAQLRQALPGAPLMAWHARLTALGINWIWLGKERTLLGQGRRQLACEGVHDVVPESLRIPIYTVTGSIGKTTTMRLLQQLLAGSGKTIGATTSYGIWIGDKRIAEGDCIGGVQAEAVLRNPDVDAAVFEVGRGGILRQGIPYEYSDVAIMLNIADVHLGLEGIDSIRQMADVKALTLSRAAYAVLNYDDEECRRLGGARAPASCIWFSLARSCEEIAALSVESAGSLAVRRNQAQAPLSIAIFRDGQQVADMSLDGVAPYHGYLGEKTLEELLAAVAAAWFGPLDLPGWEGRLRKLRLDSDNHLFRGTVFNKGNVFVVLDKAAEPASFPLLEQFVGEICQRHGIQHRLAVMTRSALELPQRHVQSCRALHRFMDELYCFDRPETYSNKAALPDFTPGSIPVLLRQAWEERNREEGLDKPVNAFADWESLEPQLARFLNEEGAPRILLINQSSTSAPELNEKIVRFIRNWAGE